MLPDLEDVPLSKPLMTPLQPIPSSVMPDKKLHSKFLFSTFLLADVGQFVLLANSGQLFFKMSYSR